MVNKFHDFFYESAEGQQYVKALEQAISEKHSKAELNPELSRDFVQRAAGVREALSLIKTLSTEAKKTKY